MCKKTLLSCALAGLLLYPACAPAPALALTADELKPALEQLLRERPEVLLDFLREHSEAVLDVAQAGSNLRRQANLEKQWAEDAKTVKTVKTEGRPSVGAPDAKVRIVAFSDFTCGYCQRAEKVLEELLQEYEGKVSFVFKNMPLEPKGLSGLASQYFVAISMQSEELAWKFYRELFAHRDELLADGEKYLRSVCQNLGVDMRKMDSERRRKKVASILAEDLKEAEDMKIEGPPYFLVNNLVIRGAVSKDLFRRAIEIELNRVK